MGLWGPGLPNLAGQALGVGFPGIQAPGVWARPVLKAGPQRDTLAVLVSLKEVSVCRRQKEFE